jgi:hypothetical protein
MKLPSVFVLSLLTAFIMLVPSSVLACACCAEPGTYSIWTGKPDKFYIDILREIEFDNDAFLYMTEAGFDSIKGLSSIEHEYNDGSWIATPGDFDLVNTFNGKVWTFTLKTPKGKTGTLRLPIPTQMVAFKVDIHDEDNRPNGPWLYKEFRFKGTVSSGSGFLGGSIANPTTYFLVFQGRGNGCDDVSNFRNWNLEITGKKARYQFFGKLDSGEAPEVEEKKAAVRLSLLTE